MAMLGMQADMQCSYVPGHYSSGDLNLNANCSMWPLKNGNAILKNHHYYNGSWKPPSPDQHFIHKEILKQKMLQHEAIFRDQIHALHRLYNRQRELMDEMKRRKLFMHHLRLEALQSNPTLCQNSFEYSHRTCQVSSSSWLNPACNQSSVLGSENNLLHLIYGHGEPMRVGCMPHTVSNMKESELLDNRCKKVGKKLLDLELPADEYIDSEEDESFPGKNIPTSPEAATSPVERICEDVQNCDDVGDEHNVAMQEDNNMTLTSYSGSNKDLADLNEPIKLEEEIDLNNDLQDPVPCHREIPCHGLSGKANPDFQIQPEESAQNTQTRGDPEACFDVLPPDKNETQQDRLSSDAEAGQSSNDLNSLPKGVCTETLSTSSEETEIKTHEISTSQLDRSSRKLRSKRKVSSLESVEGDPSIVSYSGQVVAARKHASSQLVPLSDVMNNESSSVSSQIKHSLEFVRSPIVVQALPCFNASVRVSRNSKFRSPRIGGDKSRCSKDLKSYQKLNSSSVRSSLCISDEEFMSENNCTKRHIKGSVGEKYMRDIDLNSLSPSHSSDEAAQSICIADGEKKLEDPAQGAVWLRKGSVHIGKASRKCKQSMVMESISLKANMDIDEADNGKKDEIPEINLDLKSVPDSGEQLTANEMVVESRHDEKFSGLGFHIDLNSSTNEDMPSSTPSPSMELSFVASASLENKGSSLIRGESDEDQLVAAFQLSGQESGGLPEELVGIAAEAIVSISSSQVETFKEGTTFKPSEPLRIDSLYWFARIVSSVVDDSESEFGVALSFKDPDYLSDGIDYFEAMTLNLEETKEAEHYCNTNVQMEAETPPASLPSQSRTNRTRRGRQQRKDFQSEILPSLSSLSRHEVTEDLQAIGGLIEAACTRCNKGPRKVGINRWTRSRRSRSSATAFQVENAVCISSNQQTGHIELGIDERSLIGWGKITRRRRGQRLPATNPRLVLGQV